MVVLFDTCVQQSNQWERPVADDRQYIRIQRTEINVGQGLHRGCGGTCVDIRSFYHIIPEK